MTKKTRSQEEILAEQHEQYIQMVNDSGIPIWLLDLYSNNY